MLVERLTEIDPDWRKTTVLLLDNCSIHQAAPVRRLMHELEVPFLFTGVASYLAIPVELMFSHVKHKLSKISEAAVREIR